MRLRLGLDCAPVVHQSSSTCAGETTNGLPRRSAVVHSSADSAAEYGLATISAARPLWLQVTYTWESLDGWSGIPAGGYTLKNLVLPPPVPAEAGQTYKLRLTARFTGSTAAATADVALTAVGSPLSASLLGPSGDVMGDKDIVLDASKSLDPDDPKVGLRGQNRCRRCTA